MTSASHMDPGKQEALRRLDEQLRRLLGPKIAEWLEDPAVTDIILNSSGKLWVERLGHKMVQDGTMTPSVAMAMMGTIAGMHNTILNHENPILECELPLDGSRFEGVVPPVTVAPSFTIRRPAIAVFSLQDYVDQGILTPVQLSVLNQAIRDRSNILVAGGTGSGKTTFLNAVIAEIDAVAPDDRLILLEDTRELRPKSRNVERLRTYRHITMTMLLKVAMRERPDRIFVGEMRDGAALDLLKAWNTGHPGGGASLHANSARGALRRMEQLIAEAIPTPQPEVIADGVNIVVFMAKTPQGRKVREIIAVDGHDGNDYVVRPL